jgi:tetratricopeptide (TPR) repeat protein
MQYMLDRTEEEIAAKNLASNPTVEIEVRMLVGTTYIELGLQQNAIPHLRRALELCHAESAEPTLASAAAEEALGRSLGLAEEDSTRESVELLKSSLATRRRLAGEGSLEVASSLNTLGLVYVHHGGFDAALSPLREAVAIRRNHLKPEDPDLLESIGTLAQAMWQCNLQDTAGAEALFKECVAARATLKEPDHPIVADAMYQMAHMYNGLGDSARALPIANDALGMYRRLFGEKGVFVAHCLDLIAGIHAVDGHIRDAEPLLIKAAEMYRLSYGPDSEQRLITLANLGRIYCKMGRYEKAEATLLDWYHGLERTRGAGDQDIDMARSLIRQLYQAWDKPEEAARWGSMAP